MGRLESTAAILLIAPTLFGCGEDRVLSGFCEEQNRAIGHQNEFDARKSYDRCVSENQKTIAAATRDWPDFKNQSERLARNADLRSKYKQRLADIQKAYEENVAEAEKSLPQCEASQAKAQPEAWTIDCVEVADLDSSSAGLKRDEDLQKLGTFEDWAEQQTGLSAHPWNSYNADIQRAVRRFSQ